jgi:hypothetical protein
MNAKNLFLKILSFLFGKKRTERLFKMQINQDKNVFCLGVNKEGVRCTKALDCSRYIPNPTETKTYVSFPKNYDIKNCEIFSSSKNEH